ncbi:MAG: DUF349 domain-containing protein [Propionibacteriaceae bacterium]|nr:DUF349 domain-containing protein [Propionibacteriaceae bacterium]
MDADITTDAGGLDPSPSARQAQRAATLATKESLIAQAELVAMTAPTRTASSQMKALLAQWKEAGRTTKAEDQALWDRFNTAQEQLFTRLSLLRDQRNASAAQAKQVKEGLIATAEELVHRQDLRQATETMAMLMTEWKQTPPAPDDKGLWLRFKAAQDEVYARRNQERTRSQSDQRQAADLKRSAIRAAQALVGAPDLRQATDEARTLQTAFREAGYAGHALNKDLGDQFHRAIQEFYAWMRKEPARRRDTGEQGSYSRRTRLVQQIDQVHAEIAQAEQALGTTDPSGAKKSHGRSITLTLGQSDAYSSAAAQALRLKIQLTDLESQLRSLDSRLGREDAQAGQ